MTAETPAAHQRGGSIIELLPEPLQPFSRRIPLLLTLLLAGVVGSILWLAYVRVYDAVVGAELSRLQASSDQLAVVLQGSARRLERDGARVAALPAVADALGPRPTPAALASARAALADEHARSPQITAIAVLGRDHRIVVVDGDRRAAGRGTPVVFPVPGREVGPLFASGDTVSYATTTPIIDHAGATRGVVIVVRRLANSTESAAMLGSLVGKGARVLLGNAAGDIWTDLAKPVLGPPSAPRPGAAAQYRDRGGIDRLAGASAVTDAPWVVLVEQPRAEAIAAAKQFVIQMAIIAALFIIGAALAAWALIRRSMRPLYDVADAAAALSNGDYSRRAAVSSHDEIGQLARSFNAMAERVQSAAREVASRASELEVANQELSESEHRYRGLFDHLPDGILLHRELRIVVANPAAVRLLGVPSEAAIIGRSVLDFVTPSQRPIATDRFEALMRTDAPLPAVELKVNRADKKHVLVEVMSKPLMIDGVRGVQIIMHDVTERRLLEEQLRQSQKMDAVGRLAGGVAHDFNNLLTVISAHAEFALSEGESDDERRGDIEEIRKATESAARLTRQLLTFSRKDVLTPNHIDLNEALDGVLGMVKRLIGDDIEVLTVARSNLDGIWADAGQIEQVLLNLAVNARDAMPDGGVLRFETANVAIGEGYDGASGSVIPPGNYVMLAVQDTGVGMTDDVRMRVFEPFFTTKQAGRGTGLGLSTVYGIVRQSHGHIWVYSEPGRGSTFKVYFPPHIDQRLPAPMTTTGEHRVPPMAVRALVVEDEPSVRAAVCRILRGAGFTVSEAENATRAIEILAADPSINLMITDMIMPGMSGADLVTEVAVSYPHLPVVIMSGYSEESANKEWRVPDNAVFVEKPASPHHLLEQIRDLLGRTAD